jgi:hypothetical protein
MPVFNANLFTANHSSQSYLFNQSEFASEFTSKQNLCLPLAHDSEWINRSLASFLANETIDNRFHLSTQVKHIFNKPVCFFTQYAIEETGYDFLLPMKNDFIICDYLEQFGIQSSIEIDESETKIPYLDIWLYSFFGIVDITLLAKKDSPVYECIKQGIGNNQIRHDKRLTVDWNRPISLPITVTLYDIENNPHEHRLRLFFIDIGAIHGNKGYKGVCQNVGIDVSAKSLMDNYKSDMLTGLKLHPDDYIAYANGDLNIYDVLVANNAMFENIYKDLELSDYFISPKLTIGATVADIVASAIFKWQHIPANDYHAKENKKLKRKTILNELMELSSSQYLRTQVTQSHVYLTGKIHGGRCHNNNPFIRYDDKAIADYDLAGAYSSIMQQLPFFTGKPWLYNGVNENLSLGEWKRRHLHDFDNWHYTIYVSTDDLLDYEQDFLVSWINASSNKHRMKNDKGETVYIPIADYSTGECRLYKREVVNCPITSDTIKWIDSLSKPVREDLYNKLIVKSAIGYKRSGKDKEWKSINLGELLINPLKEKRAYYKKLYKQTGDSKYNSMQELYKLVINTVYGVMCSRHFITSNVVVANQITQAIRLGMYLMEKGLNLQGSITDGCMGSLNKVVYPTSDYKIYLDKLTNLYLFNSKELNQKLHLRLGALDNANHIALSWNESKPILTVTYPDKVETITNVNEWIDEKAWQHLRLLFPDFHYLLDFLKIETKDVYDNYVYHGAANYKLSNPNYTKCAMRGYSGKINAHMAIEYDNEQFNKLDTYKDKKLPEVFLTRLHESEVEKMPVFIKSSILKSKDYVHKKFIERSELICGDDYIEVGMPNYFSLSQFTFLTIRQYEKWVWAQNRLKKDTGESFEIFFTGKDDKVDFDRMIKECGELVNSGNEKPIIHFNKEYRVKKTISPRYNTKLKASELRNALIFTLNENLDDFEQGYELEDE